jgi:hypothetical protein
VEESSNDPAIVPVAAVRDTQLEHTTVALRDAPTNNLMDMPFLVALYVQLTPLFWT